MFVSSVATRCFGQQAGGEEQILPSRRCATLFIVDATINDTGPFALIVDTGFAGALVLDPAVSGALGEFDPTVKKMETANGKLVAVKASVRIASIRVGNIPLVGSGADVLEMELFRNATRQNIQGVLGFKAFAGQTLVIDYPAGQLRLAKRELNPSSAGVVPFSCVEGGVPTISATIGEHYTSVSIDSGSIHGLVLSSSAHPSLKGDWRPIGAASSAGGVNVIEAARLDGPLVFAGFTLHDPMVQKGMLDQAIIGGELMREFCWTFDQKNELVEIRRNVTTVPGCLARRGTGLAIRPTADCWEVVSVFDDSPAEKVGIKKGDLIVRVNQKPVKTLECDAWNQLMASEQQIQLALRRGDQSLEMLVPVIVLVP